jgi:hypothetical protein
MQTNLSNVEQRVKRYWYTDGIGEIIGGGLFLLLGGYFSIQQYFGDQSTVGVILQSSLIVILIGAVIVGRRLINAWKTRLTYPRTGYVDYSTPEKNVRWRRVFSITLAMAVGIFLIAITRNINTIDSMVAVTGVLVAFILLVKQGWSFGVVRFYILSAASLILGMILSVSGLPKGYNLGLFYSLIGIAFAISGGVTLWKYLKENPMPAEESNG